MLRILRLTLLGTCAACVSPALAYEPPSELQGPVLHVIHVSVDGLHPGAIEILGPARASNFFRLRNEGAWTANARTDALLATTMPDHVSQWTGRPVFGSDGHAWATDTDPGAPVTLHVVRGEYVAGVFDVVHDSGFSTGLYASKDKFALFERSWGHFGAPDRTGTDDGRDKLDRTRIDPDELAVVHDFVADFRAAPLTYAFLHLREPDSTGHRSGWDLTPGSDYLGAVRAMDEALGALLALIESVPLRDSTVLILTADHAGELGTNVHLLQPEVGLVESGIIPFFVWGVGVARGADLYALNATTRVEPGRTIPPASSRSQPIRNGEAGNLALQLLGLPPIPRSLFNARQDLAVMARP